MAVSSSRSSIPTGEKVIVDDSKELAEQKALVARLEQELEREKSSRKTADGEVIRLRAEINGVKLNDEEVAALIPTGDGVSAALTPLDFEPTIERKGTTETDDSGIIRYVKQGWYHTRYWLKNPLL
jgi:hypothetical protein